MPFHPFNLVASVVSQPPDKLLKYSALLNSLTYGASTYTVEQRAKPDEDARIISRSSVIVIMLTLISPFAQFRC